MTTFVYKYYLREPINKEELYKVNEQIHLGHMYYNRLVEIENKKRVSIEELVLAQPEVIPYAETCKEALVALQQCEEQIKKQRAATRSNSETEEQREALRKSREQLNNWYSNHQYLFVLLGG